MSNTETNFPPESLHRLLRLYTALAELLDTFFSGMFLIEDYELNRAYFSLKHRIEEILKQLGFEEQDFVYWFPLEDLLEITKTNLYNEQHCEYVPLDTLGYERYLHRDCMKDIHVDVAKCENQTFELSSSDLSLIDESQKCIEEYRLKKYAKEQDWLKKFKERRGKAKRKAAVQVEQEDRIFPKSNTEIGLKQGLCNVDRLLNEFLSVDDESLTPNFPLNEARRVLQELKQAYEKDLYKSSVVLCGSLIEVILKYVVKQKSEDAIKAFKKRFSGASDYKDNRAKLAEDASKIDEWNMWQYCQVAERMQILKSSGTRNFVEGLWNLRNNVHIREGQIFDKKRAIICLNALDMMCEDIMNYFKT